MPNTALTEVGAPGVVRGVPEFEAAESTELPATLIATTVNVYAVPLVRPVTVHARVEARLVHVLPPGFEVTRYDVMAAPPVLDGEVQVSEIDWSETPTSSGFPGALGVVDGTTEPVDAVAEVPSEF